MAIILICFVLLFIILITAIVRLALHLKRFSVKKSYTAALEAPSVTICIPARNETHAMTQCLERVLASDYKKFEVVVYDDSSSDDTSILVKSFARAGVRFVPGDPLSEGWLGKNYALEVLAHEASGNVVVFMDVDTFIAPTTISQLVSYMITENLTMTSVIPGRNDTWRASVLFGHLRYLWEVLLSRERSPATSSSLWMIKRHVLLDTLGGFATHKNEVEPEEHVATIIGARSYHCLVNTKELGVVYEKRWRSQVETSRRLLFPMVGASWYGAIWGLLCLVLLNMPAAVLLSTLFVGWSTIASIASVLLVVSIVFYAIFLKRTWRSNWLIGALLWPVVIFQEMLLFIYSVIGYATNTVTWKGRSITNLPVHVEERRND